MTQTEVERAWAEYREALDKCVNAVKLTAFHTQLPGINDRAEPGEP